jgi:hypothetical protein
MHTKFNAELTAELARVLDSVDSYLEVTLTRAAVTQSIFPGELVVQLKMAAGRQLAVQVVAVYNPGEGEPSVHVNGDIQGFVEWLEANIGEEGWDCGGAVYKFLQLAWAASGRKTWKVEYSTKRRCYASWFATEAAANEFAANQEKPVEVSIDTTGNLPGATWES